MAIRGQHALVGIGETAVGKLPDRTALSLRLEAAVTAIGDAGMQKGQIDGVITRQPRRNPQPNYSALLSERLGIQPAYVNDISLGGAGSASMVVNAVAVLEAGLCSAVLCVAGDTQSSSRERRAHGRLASGGEDFKDPFGGGSAPIQYALAARRHMHEYGTTSRQLGAVAVACRKHASLNPNAQMQKPITIEEHQQSRLVADPLRLLDCSLVSDGAGAVIVTKAERARDCAKPPVYVLGIGSACRFSDLVYSGSLTTTVAQEAGRRAFRMAGLETSDVDVAELYDCFTSVALVTLEDYGFCQKGEGGAFVEGGRIELNGELPLNTHGGLLSQAHVGGMLHITEAVTQLRGAAGLRQVKDAEVALVSGQCGELGIHVTLLLGVSPN